MEPFKHKASPFSLVLILALTISFCEVNALSEGHHHAKLREGSPVVGKDQRQTLHANEFGEITAVNVTEGNKELPYHLQFITLEPNSLFLPVLLHAEMVFYVHSGSGKLTWADDGSSSTIPLRQGDVCSLREGSVFYIQSNLEAERIKLRIYAMFSNKEDNTYDPSIGAYSRINELLKGFDKKIMQAAFKVPEDLIETITNSNTSAIVHAVSEQKKNIVEELETSFLKNFLGDGDASNSKKVKPYNIFDNDPDLKTENGWSTTVTKKKLKSLKHTNTGFLMVHLSLGSMLGPHWNPKATELSVAVEGEGIVRTVCGSGNHSETECEDMRIKVKEGDAFVVPRFHPMAQMSFQNQTFVFIGFSTSAKNNRPQFLAGKRSVLHILDKQILATSLGVSNTTVDQLLQSPPDAAIFACCSCAEEEQKKIEEEEARKREEEKKREEETAKREQEEREREEEASREKAKREQEEKERKRAEEEARREQEREKEEEIEREKEKWERSRQAEEARRAAEAEQAKRAAEAERARREAAAEQARREAAAEQARREAAAEQARKEEARREAEAAARRKEEARREEESAESEQEQAESEQDMRERRRREEEEREQEQEGREPASRRGDEEEEKTGTEQEQEQAERQQKQREKKRGEEVQRTRGGEQGQDEREAEESVESEQEQAKREQEKREKRQQEEEQEDEWYRRDRESDNEHAKREDHSRRTNFKGSRVLKMMIV